MAKNEKMKCEGGNCGMHLCSQCALPQVIFGLLFLIVGTGAWTTAPVWFNGWSVAGAYLGMWGLVAMIMKKK